MTAAPSSFPDRAPAWWVTTDQGVILSGPHTTETEARTLGNEVAAGLRAGMRRERFTETEVRARIAALRVAYGTTSRPHGWFVPSGAADPANKGALP